MVEAVAMRTTGLGGDSEVHFQTEGCFGDSGPRRVLPVSLAALDQPQIVHDALDAQLKSPLPSEYDGRFVRRTTAKDPAFAERDKQLWFKLTDVFQSMGQVLNNRLEAQALSRLVSRGLVQIAALTPTDASHVLDYTDVWDKGAEKLLCSDVGVGQAQLGVHACDLAQKVVDQLTLQTTLVPWNRRSRKKRLTLARLLRHWPHILFFKKVFLVTGDPENRYY